MSRKSVTDILKDFPSIIDVLRYHIATGRFSYADRIMAAMDPRMVEETVTEAIRAASSASSNLRKVRGKLISFKKGTPEEKEETEIICAEEEKLDKPFPPARVKLHGRVIKKEDGSYVACFRPPKIPSSDELARFFDAIREDLSIAKNVASLAMTPLPQKKKG
jgi:CRISPR type I-A-associated protein Csa5